MKINGWKVGTVIVACFLLVAFGYGLNDWLAPVYTHAQEPVTTIATQGRFQLIRLKTNEDMLLDTATGKVFDFYNGGTVLREIPIKACTDAECTSQKGVADAR